MTWGAIAVVAAYFWGGIPTSYLVARFQHGIDIRKVGSGNVGSSNLMKTSGWKMGVLIGVFDSLGKGMAPILLVKLAGLDLWTQAAMAMVLVGAMIVASIETVWAGLVTPPKRIEAPDRCKAGGGG